MREHLLGVDANRPKRIDHHIDYFGERRRARPSELTVAGQAGSSGDSSVS
jgi:hypothetical protein